MKYRDIPAPPPKRAELSDNPVKLCNEIARIMRTKRRERGDCEGVMTQPGAHLVLSVLAINDGINQLELVKTTHLRAPTVSVILRKMEDEGIVERRRDDQKDKRAVRVYLTERGIALDRDIIKGIKEMDTLAMQGLSDEEKATLMRLLQRIRDNLLNLDMDNIDNIDNIDNANKKAAD